MSESIWIEIDAEEFEARIEFGAAEVARTEKYSDDVWVSLDASGNVVQVEFLDTTLPLPVVELCARYRIGESARETMLSCLPFKTT